MAEREDGRKNAKGKMVGAEKKGDRQHSSLENGKKVAEYPRRNSARENEGKRNSARTIMEECRHSPC